MSLFSPGMAQMNRAPTMQPNMAHITIVMTDGMLRLQKRYPVVMSVHDEAVNLIPDEEIEEGKKWCHAQMVREPKYLPGIPLGADTGVHQRYGLAKA